MATEKQREALAAASAAARASAQYKGGRMPGTNTEHPAYQKKTLQVDAAADAVSLMCTAPMCREAWSVHVPDRGIFHKCSVHAWVERVLTTPAGGAQLVDPFEGVPLFREHGRRAWAYRLKWRDDRGDPLTKYQIDKYRAALGLK